MCLRDLYRLRPCFFFTWSRSFSFLAHSSEVAHLATFEAFFVTHGALPASMKGPLRAALVSTHSTGFLWTFPLPHVSLPCFVICDPRLPSEGLVCVQNVPNVGCRMPSCCNAHKVTQGWFFEKLFDKLVPQLGVTYPTDELQHLHIILGDFFQVALRGFGI